MGEPVGIIDQVLEVVAEIVEVDRAGLTEATVLAEIGWDSLAAVSFIAAADERFGKAVAPKRLATCVTVADLAAIIQQ
jgi:acyl carrier protein